MEHRMTEAWNGGQIMSENGRKGIKKRSFKSNTSLESDLNTSIC